MSATLGPIHYWMYDKIRFREELIASLADFVRAQGYGEEEGGLPMENYTRRELPPIEEVIDLSNIHASLSGLIEGVERRYAGLITTLLRRDPDRLGAVTDCVRAFGAAHPISAVDPATAFQGMNNILLDGMPCDHAVQVREEAEDHIAFSLTDDLHGPFWEEVDGDRDIFYQLRSELVNAMLSETSFRLHSDGDGSYRIAQET